MLYEIYDGLVATARNHDEKVPSSVFPGFAGHVASDPAELMQLLVTRRQQLGFSQTEVAARMGTSQSSVARLEAGQGDVRVSTLRRYADAVGTKVGFAVPDAGEGDRR